MNYFFQNIPVETVIYFIFIPSILISAFCFKVAPDHQRFAEYKLGQFIKLLGPGLVFFIKLPGIDHQLIRISLGEKGMYLGDGLMKLGDGSFSLPIDISKDIDPGSSIVITSFKNGEFKAEIDNKNNDSKS